jgi:hypothetical protein
VRYIQNDVICFIDKGQNSYIEKTNYVILNVPRTNKALNNLKKIPYS